MMTNFGKSQSVVEGKIELSPVYRVLVSNILFSYQKLGLYLRKGWFSMVHDLIASFNVVFTLVIIFSFLKLLYYYNNHFNVLFAICASCFGFSSQ